ncbi:hypothetical protein N9X61_00640 [Sulfurimonas sp.]|nr:hypothetical protein [Sulfurimonas sp.]
MKIIINSSLLLLLFLNTLYASESFKIILGTYSSQENADTALEDVIDLLRSKKEFTDIEKKYNLKFIARPSGEYFIPIIKPFPTRESSYPLLDEIRKTYAGAFTNLSSPEKIVAQSKSNIQKSLEKKVKIAQKTPSKKTPYKKREKVNVNFSDLEIKDFIKLISKITNKNILINNKIAGKVNFVSNSPVYADELMDILISVLESKGFTLMEKGSLFQVVRSTEAAKHNAKVQTSGNKASGALMITQTIPIEGENVDVVAAKVRYLISKTAKLMTMKESNTLLITDYPSNIETIKQVIDDLVMNDDTVVKIVYVKNTEVKKLQARLVDISASLFNAAVVNEKVKIIYDDNINGIIIVGNKVNVYKIEKLISKLDIESNINKTVNIFHLKNSDAKAVLTTLTDIVSKQKFADPALKPNITASEEINSIIAVGDPVIIKGIKMIVDELDKEKFQVYVKARIVEISQTDSEDLGIKYGFAGGDVSSSGLYAMSANFGSTALTSTATAAVTSALGTIGSASTSAFALGATIDFLETNGASKSLSNPSILCVNNKESSIYVGKTISVEAASVSTTLTTGLSKSYKREDIGLTLKIKPRVSSMDKVTLDVEAILENILANDANGQPVTSKQEVKTQAILRHGESIIIGGLVKAYNSSSTTKVPLLGDIPLLGSALFSSTSDSEEQDNLVIILTPYIIDKSENLSKLQRNLGMLANLQKKYNLEIFNKMKNGTIDESESIEDDLFDE